jgi:ferredoxin/protein involved in ribonucleotide reduction
MKIININLIYFSPTHTTKKVAYAIAKGTDLKINEYNITHINKVSTMPFFQNNELVLIGLPVYSGRIPVVVLEYIKALSGQSTPCILLGVYGNRHYDDYFAELADIISQRGFIPVAAAAFLGEHSFTDKVAGGRPNTEDLKIAQQFGKDILNKLNTSDDYILNREAIPGNYPYRPYNKSNAPQPEYAPVVSSACNDCKLCVRVCPTGAIDFDNVHQINAQKCIKCCACVRACAVEAIKFTAEEFYQAKSFLETEFATVYRQPMLII